MSQRDVFGDETDIKGKTDFASLFEQSAGSVGRKLKAGDSFKAELLSIGKEEAFVSTGTPTDAMILLQDLMDEHKQIKFKVGDIIDVVVVKSSRDEVRVTRKGSKQSSGDFDSLEDAFDMELPIEGKVLEPCNGGFRVQVQGKTAFCPISQMDYKVSNNDDYVNKKFDFIITQFDPKGRNVVVSRRKLLDQQKVENEGQFLTDAKIGEIYQGEVVRMESFGAFIRLSTGIEGLVHISEIGWSRLQNPSEVLSVGQSVSVKLIKSEEIDGRLKISFSIKQAGGEGDPWLLVPEKFKIGSSHEGVVEKKETYGLFVNIAPGVTGLLPKNKWRDSLEHTMFESRKRGDKLQVRIDEIMFEQKKISLGVPSDENTFDLKTLQAKSGFANSGLGGLADLLKKK